MVYTEEVRDLFTVSDEYVLVHCISSDFAMGAGIAKRFAQLGVKEKIWVYPRKWDGHGYMIPIGLQYHIVANLVTKERYWMKPTYDTLRESLECLRDWVVDQNRPPWMDDLKLAMPLIGCGLDKLEWHKVSEIVKEVFNDTDIEILVCKQ